MDKIKNFTILILSCIVLVQAVLLLRSLPQSRRNVPARKEVKVSKDRIIPREIKPIDKPSHEEVLRPKPVLPVSGKIALVLDDWGYSLKNKDFITDNNFHVTLSILPFLAYSSEVAQLARQNNKETIIHMPMEPHNKENYGLEKNTILTSMNKATVVHLLDQAFVYVPFAKGVNNHMGSKVTEDARIMGIVIEYLKKKNLFFLDSLVTSRSVCGQVAKRWKCGYVQREIFIDNESDPVYIREQLKKLAQRSKMNGTAIGIGHDRPATLAVLKDMIPILEHEGYKFVNLSEVVEDKM